MEGITREEKIRRIIKALRGGGVSDAIISIIYRMVCG